jgi:hypothetical protein
MPNWQKWPPYPRQPSVAGRIISSGQLFDICTAVNDAVRDEDGNTNYCILAAAAARDILQATGWHADVMRVSACISPHDRNQFGSLVGSDGDGTFRPAKPGMWRGHLVAIAESKWLIDPTLDQTSLVPPMVIEFPEIWLAGDRLVEVMIASDNMTGPFIPVDGKVQYRAFPDRGGYKYAPDFRPCRRREIVKAIVAEPTQTSAADAA